MVSPSAATISNSAVVIIKMTKCSSWNHKAATTTPASAALSKARSFEPTLALILSTRPKRAPKTIAAAAAANNAPTARSLSAPRTRVPQSVAAAAQASAGSCEGTYAAMPSHSLARFLRDQAGRPPGHDGDDDGEREHVLVGAGERQRDRAHGLQAGEQEAAEDRAVDIAEPAHHGGAEAEDAEEEAHAEIDLVVVEAVHHAGKSGDRRADRERGQHHRGKIDSHGARGLAVLCDRTDRKPEFGLVDQEVDGDDHRHARDQQDQAVQPQGEMAPAEGGGGKQRRERLRIRAVGK